MRYLLIWLTVVLPLLAQCTSRAAKTPDMIPPMVISECPDKDGNAALAALDLTLDQGVSLELLTVISPLAGAVLPVDLAAIDFAWNDQAKGAVLWVVSLTSGPGGKELVRVRTDRQEWLPDQALWAWLKARAVGQGLEVAVVGLDGDLRPVSRGVTRFLVSPDPLEAALMYLEMPLPFAYGEKHPESFRWRIGDPASARAPRVVAEGLRACSNCHAASRDGRLLGMDMDLGGDKGAYVLMPVERIMRVRTKDVMTWNGLAHGKGRKSMGLFTKISPDGRWLASTVWERSFFAYLDDVWYSQFFFPIHGSIGIREIATGRMAVLPGTEDEDMVSTCPDWSPDGKSLVFARARPDPGLFEVLGERKVLPTTPDDRIQELNTRHQLRFNLYRIPFEQGRGGVAEPLAGASANGSSNYFPRHSPDGRWIMFTRSPNGLAIQPESELWIVPAAGGEARRLECNLAPMNSWHSWSPNGRWAVFSSKALGPYTQIYLAHVDPTGRSSPPVLLSRFHSPGTSSIVPELVDRSLLKVEAIVLEQ